MRTKTTKTRTAVIRRGTLALVAALGCSVLAEEAQAQEILLTGPLAGAPAVRKLRLYREGRFEVAPAVSFTLLDEYQRHILLGGRINYNFTDWLAFGAWGGVGSVLQFPTALSEEIQSVNADREPGSLDRRLTAVNLGDDFEEQLAGIDWIASPQLTFVPFRGKLALFQGIYLDTDLYFFGGPAFVGLSERGNCGEGEEVANCTSAESFELQSRIAIAPNVGLGLSFYLNDWSALGFEARGVPFSWNTAGFDVAGTGEDDAFPDDQITDADRQFKTNLMLTVSYNIYLPTAVTISE